MKHKKQYHMLSIMFWWHLPEGDCGVTAMLDEYNVLVALPMEAL